MHQVSLTGASLRPPIPASTYLSFTEMTQAVTGLPFPIASLTCLTLEQKGSEGSHIFSQSICRTSFHGRNLKSLPPWKERLDEEHLVLILLGVGVLKCADELLIEKKMVRMWKKFVNSSGFLLTKGAENQMSKLFFSLVLYIWFSIERFQSKKKPL